MATVNSDIYDAQKPSARAKDRLVDGARLDGTIRYANAKHTFAAVPSNGDLVALCTLPENAQIIPALSSIASSAALCNDINVGTSDNSNEYADALDLSGGAVRVAFAGGDSAAILPDKFSADTTIYAELVSGATGIAIGEIIEVCIAYRIAN